MKANIVVAIVGSLVGITASGKQPDVVASTIFMITEIKDFVTVSGTWTIPDARTPGEKIADPINAVKIWCQKTTSQCFEAFGRVQYANSLSVDLIPYDVTSWTKQEITAETGALCATSTLTINFLTKEVYRITRNGGASPNGCKDMSAWEPLKKPVVEKLINGYDAINGVSGSP
jgi:hypothetical protein